MVKRKSNNRRSKAIHPTKHGEGIEDHHDPRPRRPLTAYNMFFQLGRPLLLSGGSALEITGEDIDSMVLSREAKRKQRGKHIRTHGKMSFREMATTIGRQWKQLDPILKAKFQKRFLQDRAEYKVLLKEWQDRAQAREAKLPKTKAVCFDAHQTSVAPETSFLFGGTPPLSLTPNTKKGGDRYELPFPTGTQQEQGPANVTVASSSPDDEEEDESTECATSQHDDKAAMTAIVEFDPSIFVAASQQEDSSLIWNNEVVIDNGKSVVSRVDFLDDLSFATVDSSRVLDEGF